MNRYTITLLATLAVFIAGCGSNGTDTNTTTETNITKETNNTVQLQDINITNNNPIENNISNEVVVNVDVNISALESGYYGEGTFENPYQMMEANYALKKGEAWFMSPTLNANCTVRMRTRIYITNIEAESSELLPIEIVHLNSNVIQFDINDSWATLDFIAQDDGYVTMIGDCLDSPKLYNLGQ